MTKLAHFAAPLTCLTCHHTTSVDNGTQTALLDYRTSVGFEPGIELGSVISDLEMFAFEDAYIKLRAPEQGEPVRILETWRCSACRDAGRPGFRWATAVFEGQRFSSITDRALTLSVLHEVHFACQSLVLEVIERHLGTEALERYWLETGDLDSGFIPFLAAHLPAD